MRIGIDARLYGPAVGGGGLGRYVEQLVLELQKQDRENRYVLFLKPENFETCRVDAPNFEKRLADAHWYTAKEQAVMPGLIDRERLDLVHFPHWNVPLLVRTPFVVTIHDLILLEQPASAKATTRHPAVYGLKRLGYRVSLANAIHRSKHIVAVSEYTKASIGRFFPSVPEEKISVVYEGVTELGGAQVRRVEGAMGGAQVRRVEGSQGRYFLYVGNAYPHKNLETLVRAFTVFSRRHPDVELVLAGRDDMFYKRLRREIDGTGAAANVRFVMNPTDAELAGLYRGATLYLFPSRSEGFGLPPLEAMSAGVPVAAARATSLPEILGDAALYFSPDDADEMAAAMETILSDEPLRRALIAKGHERITRYSWSRMAAQTRDVYERIAHRKTE